MEWVSKVGSWGILYLRNTYVLLIPRPYPFTLMVTYSNDRYSRFLLGLIVSLQLAIGDVDEHTC